MDGEEDIATGLDLFEFSEVLVKLGAWQAIVSKKIMSSCKYFGAVGGRGMRGGGGGGGGGLFGMPKFMSRFNNNIIIVLLIKQCNHELV